MSFVILAGVRMRPGREWEVNRNIQLLNYHLMKYFPFYLLEVKNHQGIFFPSLLDTKILFTTF